MMNKRKREKESKNMKSNKKLSSINAKIVSKK